MPKTTHKNVRYSEQEIEFVEGLSQEKNFTEGIKKLIENAKLNKRNRVEVTTQKEIAHEKTASPQITAFMPKEPTSPQLIENQIPPCEYASLVVKTVKLGLEYLAYCDNPMKTNLLKNRLLPISACQKCYLRTKEPLETINKEIRWFFCNIEGYKLGNGTEIEGGYELSELYCIQNPDFDCPCVKSKYYSEQPCILNEHKEWRRLF